MSGLFLTFSALLVANPKKTTSTRWPISLVVCWTGKKKKKKKSGSTPHAARSEKIKIKITRRIHIYMYKSRALRRSALRRSRCKCIMVGFSPTSYCWPNITYYYHRGTRLNAIERFCLCTLWFDLNVLPFFSPWLGDAHNKAKMRSDFSLKNSIYQCIFQSTG